MCACTEVLKHVKLVRRSPSKIERTLRILTLEDREGWNCLKEMTKEDHGSKLERNRRQRVPQERADPGEMEMSTQVSFPVSWNFLLESL